MAAGATPAATSRCSARCSGCRRRRASRLAGIQRILELENQVAALRARVAELADALTKQADRADARAQLGSRIFAAGTGGEIVAVRPGERPPRFGSASQALVLWRPGLGRPSAPR